MNLDDFDTDQLNGDLDTNLKTLGPKYEKSFERSKSLEKKIGSLTLKAEVGAGAKVNVVTKETKNDVDGVAKQPAKDPARAIS